MEVDADCDVVQRERGVVLLRMESKLAILVAVPQDAALMELNHLLALNQIALSHVRLVERERYLRAAHDAYRYVRLLACEVGVRSEVARCKCA